MDTSILVGYVSDERYVALSDVQLEFRRGDQVVLGCSTISGAIYVALEPGTYEVVLGKKGYGSKIIFANISGEEPFQFRLLSDCLLGYMYPRAVTAGESF
jgi:hypothetical protein